MIYFTGPHADDMSETDFENAMTKVIRSILEACEENGFESISVPAISTGIYNGVPRNCADLVFSSMAQTLKKCSKIKLIRMVFNENEKLKLYSISGRAHFP